MSPDLARLREIFGSALDKSSGAERGAFLDEACGKDVALRLQVEALLAADEAAGSFLPLPEGMQATASLEANVAVGETIGLYTLIEKIGEGGFGVVFLAEQRQPIRRRVALKLLKPGMDTRQVIARFEAERQALALMDHPNIAKVYDAGATPAGRPYFVMELVKGIAVTTYCDQCSLPIEARLELFVAVCQAVQHAHQKGVIHRDIKPSNVLVAMQDGVPTIKVIDFGVAKAINQRLTDQSLYTGFAQLIGTPLYMSPEQAEMSPLEIDTRGDIYSLGVLLYELLTGTTPFDRERILKASFDEMRRIIREEEPPLPSTRFSTLSAAASSTVANQRRSERRRLAQALRGDLDWIVTKCLEKDRTRRYETAAGLAADIQRYRSDEPVTAAAPSRAYRVRKFVRRNRGLVFSASAVLLAVIAGGAAASIGLIGEAKQRAIAEQREKDAKAQRARAEAREAVAIDAVNRFRDVVVVEPALMNTPELELLRKRLLKEPLTFFRTLRDQLQADGDTRPESLGRLAVTSYALGNLAYEIGDRQDALSAYRESRAIWERLALAGNQYQIGLAKSNYSVGKMLRESGELDEALEAYHEALVIWERLAQENSTVTECRSGLGATHNEIGLLLKLKGKLDEALAAHEKSVAIIERLVRENGNVTQFQTELASSYNNIGTVLREKGNPQEALAAHQKALVIHERLALENRGVTQFQSHLAASYNNIALLLQETGKSDEALATYKQAGAIQDRLARENPAVAQFQRDLAGNHYNVGILLHETGKRDEGLAEYKQALVIHERLAREHRSVIQFQRDLAGNHLNIGNLLDEAGKPDEARKAFQQARAIQERLAHDYSTETLFQFDLALSHYNIGRSFQATDNSEEAIAAYEQARAIWERLAEQHSKSPEVASMLGATLNNLATLDVVASRFPAARDRLQQAITWQKKALAVNPLNPQYRQFLTNHYTLLNLVAEHLNEPHLAAEAQQGLSELQATASQSTP